MASNIWRALAADLVGSVEPRADVPTWSQPGESFPSDESGDSGDSGESHDGGTWNAGEAWEQRKQLALLSLPAWQQHDVDVIDMAAAVTAAGGEW